MNHLLLKKYIFVTLGFLCLVFCSRISVAQAATPTVSASYTGTGDSVQLNVAGDPNASVILNYLGTGSIVRLSAIGTTNSAGTFSMTISSGAYGIAPGSLINVSVNNFRSDSIVWPYGTTASTGSGTISLSQTNAALTVGQSLVISVNNTTGNSLYLASNTVPTIANISINNNQITILGITAGSTSFQVCSVISSSNCATAVVTVQASAVQTVGFSQNNLTVASGQTVPVTVTGGTGTYVVSSNSNPTAIQATLTGSTVNLFALTSSGSASVTVCSSNLSSCGVITVTAGTVSSASGSLTFSQANPSLTPGQILPITISGGSGSYYVSSNSNSSVIQSNVVGNVLTLYGNSTGSTVLSICAASGGCGTLTLTVAAAGTLPLTLSQNTILLSTGQTNTITLSGAGGYSVSNNTNPYVASTALSGNTLVVTAGSAGSTMVTVCQSGGGCAFATITVSSSAGTPAPSLGVALATTHLLTVGQEISLAISGGSGSYTLSSNPGIPFSAALSSANLLVIRGTSVGSASVNVCATSGGCVAIAVKVADAPAAPVSSVPVAVAPAPVRGAYKFANAIVVGDRGPEVVELQKRLKKEGIFTGEATGFFGAATLEAVKKYQVLHKLNPIGTVGPSTRAFLNE